MTNIEYKEISTAKVTDTRCIVISECSKGGYTVAQRMNVTENDNVTQVYMKGAFHISDVNGLYNLRDAINLAIDKIRESYNEEDAWDD